MKIPDLTIHEHARRSLVRVLDHFKNRKLLSKDELFVYMKEELKKMKKEIKEQRGKE